MADTSSPGSGEAVERGCTCPILDNGRGRGYMGGAKDRVTGKTLFVISGGCPLHARMIQGQQDGCSVGGPDGRS